MKDTCGAIKRRRDVGVQSSPGGACHACFIEYPCALDGALMTFLRGLGRWA